MKEIKINKEKLIIGLVFTDSKLKCWKFKFDMYKVKLDELLICLEEQYKI